MTGSITFFGAAGNVTGSKHVLKIAGKTILLDCGTFQGLPDVRERNRSLPFTPESIDAVIISHAHLDHIGMLPLLVKRGFKGPIFATPTTIDVARYMLNDAAHIEIQDAAYNKKHHLGPPDARHPLFTPHDIPLTMERFKPTPYARHNDIWHDISDNIRFKLYDAGHILGSAVIVIEVEEQGTMTHVAYTGDLGPQDVPLLHNPEIPTEPIETLILESTYGSRSHEPLEQAMDRLAKSINNVYNRGGKMILPSFSLGRTQFLVYLLHKLTDENKIPRFPIYVDSPLATAVTEVFKTHAADFDEETLKDFTGQNHEPLLFSNLKYVQSVEESKKINTEPGPLMIISASGMMTGGRVLHHLRYILPDPKNAIFITGYQAAGTLGRHLLEGAQDIDILGDSIPVRAEMLLFNEFSAHADQQELQAYAEKLKNLKQIMLVHGEPHQADDLKDILKIAHPEWKIDRPEEGDTIPLVI